MSKPRLPPKKDVALALLENTTVFLHLDPRAQEVRVPPWFKRQPQLVLQVGLNMPVPIPDLTIDETGISCTLSFSRTPHYCSIPWRAIYALVGEDGRGMVWPDDVPPEVAAQAQTQAQKEKKPHLRAVSEADSAAPAPAPAPAPAVAPEAKAAPKKRERKKSPERVPALTEAGPKSVPQPEPAPPSVAPDSAADSKKGKRELPPYLRVVK